MARTISVLGFWLAILFASASLSAIAQGAGIAQITGTVLDDQHHGIANAQVHLTGPVAKTTVTGTDGSFAFSDLPIGLYQLNITKAGFNATMQDNIATAGGSTTNLGFTLLPVSLTSLTIIGNVSVSTGSGANSINTTPSAIVDVPASTFVEQGQLSVNQVLNEEPGITIGVNGCNATGGFSTNGASPLALGIPSIRGGLPYETESLIDGHTISLGEQGTFSPSFISPYMLQNVEIVKGPGATSPSINYAINGTVNYRTLEPTATIQNSVDFGEDQYGGNFANFRATGRLPGGHLSYAFDYETQGTQGADRGFTAPAVIFAGTAPTTLNGAPINVYGGFGLGAGPPGEYGAFSLHDSFLVCCLNTPQDFNERNELGKIRYAFTPSTTLTVTYLGGQVSGAAMGGYMSPYGSGLFTFTPPAGYTGALAPGSQLPFTGGFWSSMLTTENTNLFETEFHMPLGNTATLLLRQYSSSIQTYYGGPGDSTPSDEVLTGSIYGGVYYAGATTPTIFNGQVGTIVANQDVEQRSYNNLNGYTAQIDKQAGNDLISLSYDEEKTSTYATQNCLGTFAVNVPAGSSQTFQSLMARGQLELGENVNATISDNFGSYTDTYTQNAGLSFQSSTHVYQAPRLSLTWRRNANQSFRASLGTSVAPPYIALLNNNQIVSGGGGLPATYYTETLNSGDVLPETAFGFDLGFDARLHSPDTILSADVYQTILHDQFLSSTSPQGTYTCTAVSCGVNLGVTGPLYVTKTANLGHSEYEGVEVSLHRLPSFGWGYRLQGSLQRAFVYDLPAGFYNTSSGPYTTNLGVLPNINFQGSGLGYNAMSTASVPYSMGYGEINYRAHNGAYFLAGVTYYGSNNSYNEPAFEVVTASFTQPLTRRASLQLSVYNLTNTYPSIYYYIFDFNHGGVLAPLANGQLGVTAANSIGPETARLTLHVDL